jgi:hypothetical protein
MTTIDQAGDIDEFTRLKADQDPRTIEQMIADDETYDVVIDKVEEGTDGWWTVQWDGMGTSVRGAQPAIGDTITFYGREFGERHGWALNGEVVEWKTPWERFAERVAWLADYDRRKREEFGIQQPKLDAAYDALPAPLKARIDRFRAAAPDFRIDSEGYEMFCCTEAAKLAQASRDAVATGADADEVDRFWDTPEMRQAVGAWAKDEPAVPEQRWLLWAWSLNSAAYDYDHERQTRVTGLDGGHSGNTAGGSFSLAFALLEGADV